MSEGGKPKANVGKAPALVSRVASYPGAGNAAPAALAPAALAPSALAYESAELSPSVVADTHTADTSPVSLPRVAMKPLEPEPASSFPPLAADASAAKPHGVSTATLRGVLLGRLWRRRGSKGPHWEWALAGFCSTLLVVTLTFRWLERSLHTEVEGTQSKAAAHAHGSPSAPHDVSPAPKSAVRPSPGPNAPPPASDSRDAVPVPLEKVPLEKPSVVPPMAAQAPAIRTAKRALRPMPITKAAPLPSPPPAAPASTSRPPPPAPRSTAAARPGKALKSEALKSEALKSEARGSVRAGLAQELP